MDKEHLLKHSLSKALAGFSENMCIWINKSWYRDTIVQFQYFLFFFCNWLQKLRAANMRTKQPKSFLNWDGRLRGNKIKTFKHAFRSWAPQAQHASFFFAVTTIMLWWKSIFMFVHDHCVILFKASDTLWFETVFSWWHRFCQIVCCVVYICLSEVIDNVLASVQLNENDRPLFENGN